MSKNIKSIVLLFICILERNFQTVLESTTISHSNPGIHRFILPFNFIISLGFTIALVIWTLKEKDMVLECSKYLNIPSYFTVMLKNIPNYYRENEIRKAIEGECGPIRDIYTVKNYGEDL